MNFAIFNGYVFAMDDDVAVDSPGQLLGKIDYDAEDFRSEFADLNVGGDCYRMDERLLRFLTHTFGESVVNVFIDGQRVTTYTEALNAPPIAAPGDIRC
jgi:hypothetical protein